MLFRRLGDIQDAKEKVASPFLWSSFRRQFTLSVRTQWTMLQSVKYIRRKILPAPHVEGKSADFVFVCAVAPIWTCVSVVVCAGALQEAGDLRLLLACPLRGVLVAYAGMVINVYAINLLCQIRVDLTPKLSDVLGGGERRRTCLANMRFRLEGDPRVPLVS